MPIERATLVLQLSRSAQSGSKTLTGAYTTVFEDSDTNPWIFMGAKIDRTNMGAGDTVYIRISEKIKSGGAYVVVDEKPYSGVPPDSQKQIKIDASPNAYGYLIEAYQSAGAPPFLALDMEFWVAKR